MSTKAKTARKPKDKTAPKHPNRLAVVMEEKGFTPQKLIEATGMAEGTVYELKNQNNRFSQTSLKKCADALGVPQGALLEDGGSGGTPTTTAAGVRDIPHNRIYPSKLNPRRHFNPDAVSELADAIAQEGILENLVVRPMKGFSEAFEIVAGERRWRAAQKNIRDGKSPEDMPVPCRVKDLSDIETLRIATMENVQREDLHPLEEGEAYRAMVEAGDNTETIAVMIGKTQRHVQLRIELAEKLAEPVKDRFMDGGINLAQARALAKAPADQQDALAERAATGWYKSAQALAEDILSDQVPIEYALFDTDAYTGAFTEDPDDPEKIFFADKAQFMTLQGEAVEKRKAKYLKAYAFAEICPAGETFKGWTYEPCKDKTVAGVVIDIHQSGKVKFHTGLVLKQTELFQDGAAQKTAKAKTDTDGPAEPVITKALVNLAKNRKTEMLQAAVSRDPNMALRIAVLSFMGGGQVACIEAGHMGADNAVLDHGVADRLNAFRKHFGKALRKQDVDNDANWGSLQLDNQAFNDKSREHEAAAFQALLDMDMEDVETLFNHLVASRCATFFSPHRDSIGDDPVPVMVAQNTVMEENHAAQRTDAEFLAKLDRAGLVELAQDAGIADDIQTMNGKPLMSMQVKTLREDVERDLRQSDYVHPLLRFATDADIAKAKSERRSPKAQAAE